MITVVFGAGASYDSAPSHATTEIEDWHQNPHRPPLADQLFQERPDFALAARELPELLAIVPYLRHIGQDTSLEQELERLRDQAAEYRQRSKQLISIRFYLQRIIWECQRKWVATHMNVTNYQTLLDEIERLRKSEPVCVVTFNYDTMLEDAFSSLHRNFESVEDYMKDPPVIKLHGSVNWVRAASNMNIDPGEGDSIAKVVDKGADLSLTDNYQFVSEGQAFYGDRPGFQRVFGGKFVLPAIAIPVEKKQEYECPPSHVARLKECLRDTSRLLLIGWKGAEANFVSLLRDNLPGDVQVMVVANGTVGARRMIIRLQSELKNFGYSRYVAAPSGFTDLLLSRRLPDFIRT
jgi:hypothetical protein